MLRREASDSPKRERLKSDRAAGHKGKICYFDRRKWIGNPKNAAQPT
jgi:hypothetical protein